MLTLKQRQERAARRAARIAAKHEAIRQAALDHGEAQSEGSTVMKKGEVKVGGEYVAKVSGKLAHVRIDRENPHGGWDATNLATKKSVRIKSTRRLQAEAGRKAAPAAHVATGARPAGEVAKDTKPAPAATGGKPGAAGAKPSADTKAAKLTTAEVKAPKAAAVAAWRKDVADKAAKPDPELDAAIKASEAGRGAKKAKAAKPKGERKSGVLNAAVKVLQAAGKPMNCADIVKEALEKGYWKTGGQTPGATLYAAVLRECAAKGAKARFHRAEVKETKDGKAVTLRGYFALADEHAGKGK